MALASVGGACSFEEKFLSPSSSRWERLRAVDVGSASRSGGWNRTKAAVAFEYALAHNSRDALAIGQFQPQPSLVTVAKAGWPSDVSSLSRETRLGIVSLYGGGLPRTPIPAPMSPTALGRVFR